MGSSLVQLKGTVHAVLGDLTRFDKSGKTCVAVWSTAERVAEALLDVRIRASGLPRSRFDGREDIYYDPDEMPKKKDTPAAAEDDDDSDR